MYIGIYIFCWLALHWFNVDGCDRWKCVEPLRGGTHCKVSHKNQDIFCLIKVSSGEYRLSQNETPKNSPDDASFERNISRFYECINVYGLKWSEGIRKIMAWNSQDKTLSKFGKQRLDHIFGTYVSVVIAFPLILSQRGFWIGKDDKYSDK